MESPRAACGVTPQGAAPAAEQSPFRGIPWDENIPPTTPHLKVN